MQRSLRPMLLRGSFGVALSLAVVASAATQAARFEGDWRLEEGRLVLIDSADALTQCLTPAAAPLTLLAARTPES